MRGPTPIYTGWEGGPVQWLPTRVQPLHARPYYLAPPSSIGLDSRGERGGGAHPSPDGRVHPRPMQGGRE
jgi:hypothetical protein